MKNYAIPRANDAKKQYIKPTLFYFYNLIDILFKQYYYFKINNYLNLYL